MLSLGDFPTGATLHFKWDTTALAGESITRATNGTLLIYKGSSVTERSSAVGITETEDFDGKTGVHHVTINLADNTDAGFYAAGNEYQVVMSAMTIDGKTVNATLAHFSIERAGSTLALLKTIISGAGVNVTQLGGVTQSLTDLKDFADDGYDPATNKVQGVVLTDTLTTYTGNTPQTGDNFARTGVNGVGLSVLATQASITTLSAFVDTEVAAILAAVDTEVASTLAAVDTEVAAIKAKTDQLTFTTANKLDATIQAAGDFAQAAADKVWASASRTLTAFSTALAVSVWDVLASAVATASSIGLQIKTNLDGTVSSRASQTTLDTLDNFVDTEVATILAAVDTEVAAIKVKTDQLTFTTANKLDATIQAAGDFAQAAADKVWASASRTLSAFSTALAVSVWDVLAAAVATASSIGLQIKTNLDATVSSRASQTTLDTLDNFVDTEVASILAAVDTEVGAIKAVTDLLPNAGALTSLATAANLATVAGYLDTEMAATLAAVDTEVAAIKAVTDLLPNAGALTSLATAASITALNDLTATEVENAVWNTVLASHLTAGSTGNALNAAGSAGDPWTTALPGAYGAGSAGAIIGSVPAIKAKTDNLPTDPADESSLQASIAALVDLSATDVENAVWNATMASHLTGGSTGASLNGAGSAGDPWTTALPGAYGAGTAGAIVGVVPTILAAVDTEVAAIKAKTDQLTFTTANKLDATIQAAGDFAQAAADKVWASATRTLSAFSTALAVSVWDVLTSAVATASSLGLQIKTNLDALVSSRSSQTSIATLSAFVDTEVAAIKAVTDLLPNAGALTALGNLDATVSSRAAGTALVTLQAFVDTEVASILAAVDTEVASIKAVTDLLPNAGALSALANLDVLVSSRLATAGYTGPLSGSQVATAVWDAVLASYAIAGSTGAALSAAGGSGDPWSTVVPGAYGAGTAGALLGNNLDVTVSSRLATAGYTGPMTAGQVATAVWDALIASYLIPGSTGALLNGAGASGDPWAVLTTALTVSGSVGELLADLLAAILTGHVAAAGPALIPGDTSATRVATGLLIPFFRWRGAVLEPRRPERVLIRHDRRVVPVARLLDEDGYPLDLTGLTVRYTLKNLTTGLLVITRQLCTLEDQVTNPGEVSYPLTALDVATAFNGCEEWTITHSVGIEETFPANGIMQVVRIVGDVDNI